MKGIENLNKIQPSHRHNKEIGPLNTSILINLKSVSILSHEEQKQKDNRKAEYYKKVWEITNKNAPNLKGIELRSWKGFHIDHIIPIIYGFKNDISPEEIGSLKNLQMLYHRDNMLKGARLKTKIKFGMSKPVHFQWYFGIGLGFVSDGDITVIVLPFVLIFWG